MTSAARAPKGRLGLRAGDLVEVRPREEILATLDETGALDGLPFMPEMLAFCGQRLRVAKRADKTCDTIEYSGLRRMEDTVHLAGTRCTGFAHGGCEASCQIFWKEAWLKRPSAAASPSEPGRVEGGCTLQGLQKGSLREVTDGSEPAYRCQATDLLLASTPQPAWNLLQYVRDLRSRNARVTELSGTWWWMATRWARERLRGYRLQVSLFNVLQRLRGGRPYDDIKVVGTCTRTPATRLDLVPGELVMVKTPAEIRDTLDANARNRGLYFDTEMTPYCGGTYRVRSRVSRIIEEKTGRMITIPGDCVILDDVVCTGRYHGCCPRAIFPYWREVWLQRPSVPPSTDSA